MDDRQALSFSREDMREIGYAVIDSLLDYYDSRDQRRVAPQLDHAALEAILREPLPREASDWRDVLAQFQQQVVEATNHVDHPRFFGYIPLANNFIGVMADALAAGHNIFNAIWLQGPGAAQIEWLTIDWLRQIMRMPAGAGGTFVSGGSVANSVGAGCGANNLAEWRHVRRGRLLFRSAALRHFARIAGAGLRRRAAANLAQRR